MDSIKVCNIKVKVFWIIFILLNVATLIFMIGVMASPKWVKMDDAIEDVVFEGDIYRIKEASGSMSAWKDENYQTISDDWCDLEEDSIGIARERYQAGCTLFSLLLACCAVFVVFELCAFAYTVLNIVGLVLFFFQKDCIWMSLASIIASNVWNFIAFTAYAGALRLNFEDECDDFRQEDRFEPLCGEDGPSLALFLLLFMVIYGILQCLCIGLFYSNRKKQPFEEREMQQA